MTARERIESYLRLEERVTTRLGQNDFCKQLPDAGVASRTGHPPGGAKACPEVPLDRSPFGLSLRVPPRSALFGVQTTVAPWSSATPARLPVEPSASGTWTPLRARTLG